MKNGFNPTIGWTKEKFELFKQEYAKHRSNGPDYVFKFEGHEVLVQYAKYLIEYLEGQFNDKAHISDFINTDS